MTNYESALPSTHRPLNIKILHSLRTFQLVQGRAIRLSIYNLL